MWHSFSKKLHIYILSKVMGIWEYAEQQKQLIQHRKAIVSLEVNIYLFSCQTFCLITMMCTTLKLKDNVRPAIISSYTLKCSLTNCNNKQQYKSQKGQVLGVRGVGPGKICRNMYFLANVSLVIKNIALTLYLVSQLTKYDFT